LRLTLLFFPLALIAVPLLIWPIVLEQTWQYVKETILVSVA
jgi:hypothetical protein